MRATRGGFIAICSWYLTTQECTMNAFVEHHKDSIQFRYRCFDRILLNCLIKPFQQPERVLGFFNTYRDGQRVTRRALTEIADQFQYWLKNRAEKWVLRFWRPPKAMTTRAAVTNSLRHISVTRKLAKWWPS